MRHYFKKYLPAAFSFVVAWSGGAAFFGTIAFWLDIPAAVSFSTLVGLLEGLEAYYFRGPQIKKYLGMIEEEPIASSYDEPFRPSPVKYYLTFYGYRLLTTVKRYANLYFLIAAANAWSENIQDENADQILVPLTDAQLVMMSVYFFFIALPFDHNTDISVACERLVNRYGIEKTKAHCLKPIFKHKWVRQLICVAGSAGDSLESSSSMLLLIPPSFARGAFRSWLGSVLGAGGAVVLTGAAAICFLQTYYFEGTLCAENLRNIAEVEDERDLPRISLTDKKYSLFRHALNVCGPVYSAQEALPIIKSLRLFGADRSTAYSVTAPLTIIGVFGNHYSLVESAKEEFKIQWLGGDYYDYDLNRIA